ncbi:MAG TPA: hypothetical protein VIY28_17505 [Pseudonocardiaceae bacterium]
MNTRQEQDYALPEQDSTGRLATAEPNSATEPQTATEPRTAEPQGADPGLAQAQPEEASGRTGDQAAADGDAERVGLLTDAAGLRAEWQRVQGTFVDDPESAVHEASALVERTLDEIRANIGSAGISETPSTEDLRVSFRRYREFFQRLLSA